jgi:ferredoxin-NADP reductase
MNDKKVYSTLALISSHDEVDNVRTFIFERNSLDWVAGQAQAYVLPAAGESEEENQRWFTISSAQVENTVNISTRISSSAFKQALNTLKPGEQIRAHSLGGPFTWEADDNNPVILVAAGIGITPFRSILLERKALGKSLDATLLYFNRTNKIPFQKELEEISAEHPGLQIKIIVGEPVTAEKILESIPGDHKETYYLSGPAPLVSSVGSALKELGVAIKLDHFPGYDESNF